METKKDYSFGVIPLYKNGDTFEVFILNQISLRNDIYWTFPKGHSDAGETPVETAHRELVEEAGIKLARLDEAHTFTQSYSFTHNNVLVEKVVVYYLGFAENKTFTIQPDEVVEGKWCTFSEARVLLTHELAKQLLDEVALYLSG